MLVFIDESGQPRPGDPSTRPVILAVCIRERDYGRLTQALFTLRRTLLSKLSLSRDEQEGKAVEFLTRYALMKVVAKREYIESLFEMLRDFDLKVFGIVMERPPGIHIRAPTSSRFITSGCSSESNCIWNGKILTDSPSRFSMARTHLATVTSQAVSRNSLHERMQAGRSVRLFRHRSLWTLP